MIWFAAIIIPLFCYLESPIARLILGFIFLSKLFAYWRSSKLEFHFSKTNNLFSEFVEKSKIKKMKYEPYLWAPHNLQQGIFYVVSEIIYKKLNPNDFKREMFTLPDGGTIGFDWDGDIPDPTKKPDKPYLLICPGLGGDS